MLVSIIDGAVQAAVQSSNSGGGTVIYNPSGSQERHDRGAQGHDQYCADGHQTQGDRIQVLGRARSRFRSVYELRSNPGGR
jgi:type IV secretion system protein VirB10